MIELKHVSKTFVDGKHSVEAVKDVSLTIDKGEIFGIIGFSGAGKSTLVRCINLLERPTSGSVVVGGRDLLSLKPAQLRDARKKIGMIFQHFNLMPTRTVLDNALFPLKHAGLTREEAVSKARNLLSLVDIAEKEDAYPSQLSGGQKQRVAIARALANDPDVLLCDEATSALDPQTTKAILRLLKKLNTQLGLTIVIITHEMAVVKEICDRVAVMEAGVVVEQGRGFDIFANPQNPLTRKFIDTTSNLEKVDELIKDDSSLVRLKPGQAIWRTKFVKASPSQPLLFKVCTLFGIELNIIYADISFVQDYPIGGTVLIVSGTEENQRKAKAWLEEKNVSVEVLKS